MDIKLCGNGYNYGHKLPFYPWKMVDNGGFPSFFVCLLEGYHANLVGGFNLPLWKIMEWKSVGMMKFPTEWKIKINVPNHQSDNKLPIYPWLVMLTIPPIYGEDWGMVYEKTWFHIGMRKKCGQLNTTREFLRVTTHVWWYRVYTTHVWWCPKTWEIQVEPLILVTATPVDFDTQNYSHGLLINAHL